MVNNIMKNYDEFWKNKASKDNWREFILPKRSNEEFYNEGQTEAGFLSSFYHKSSTVLEFGCGIGRVLQYINANNRIGVDVCQEFLDKIPDTIQKVKTNGLIIPHVNEESIDFIYSLMVFQHINKNDHVQLLNQLYSFLKPQGKMLIQFPTNLNEYYHQGKFVNVYSKEEISEYMSKIGASDYSIKTGNLVGYGDGLVDKTTPHREYFVLIKKIKS
jgi:trans-aconitate methyltransferase